MNLRTRAGPWSVVLTFAVIHAAGAAPIEHGKQLHNQHCTACHGDMTGGDGSTLYTRDRRRVNSLAQLRTQVRRCASGKGVQWSDVDVAAVTKYLNAEYYRFGQ